MKLQDFLKVKKVKFVGASDLHLTNGKHYTLLGVTDRSCIVNYDNECEAWADMNYFEPVLDSAENPLQGMEPTPELEAVEPKFKVGDKVYYPSFSHEICIIKLGDSDDLITLPNNGTILAGMGTDLGFSHNDKEKIWEWGCEKYAPAICHATPENHALLSKLHPHIKFEAPPKELKGSDLARALIKKGWVGFNCLCGNSGDDHVITHTIVTGINNSWQFTTVDGRLFNNAVPMLGSYPLQAREVGL